MKVTIGPYRNCIGPYQLAEYILFWKDRYKEPDNDVIHEFGRKLDSIPGLTKFCQWIDSFKKRKIKVRIDRYDTWSMDHTLALIILPMIKQLKGTKHGSPIVEDEDVPEELRSTSAPSKENEWDLDEFHHKRWNWVLDQMIWSFEQKLNDNEGRDSYYEPYKDDEAVESFGLGLWEYSEEEKRKRGKFNREKYEKYQAKLQLGFTLFGKYFQALWD